MIEPIFNPLFDSLWEGYSTDKLWEVDEDALHVLRTLNEQGIKVAVLSNFDERLVCT